jgi:anaerobic magnesium-protoporphyrin IX monomethyl ester cyclase
MKVALVGAELEENLGLRYLHSSIEKKGHRAEIFDFHSQSQTPAVVAEILKFGPELVGLSMVFTGRAREFVELAKALRETGFTGHITAGGHFASFHARELLTGFEAFDSIVHGEGEETIVDLIEHLSQPGKVMGISYRDRNGTVQRTPPRPNPDDLDTRPFPSRPAYFQSYLGLPIANMLGSRGCYGNCHYCSITAWYKQNPGKRFRQRSVENIAREMAQLYHQRGVRIFNFHDDNFFLPSTRQTMARFSALQRRLEKEGVGRIAIQLKARPDSVQQEPISILKEMGLFRVFLGVESNAAAGLKALGRGITTQQNHRALNILQDFDLHVTFNLLMFEPETTVTDIRDNIVLMQQYSHMPLNFGRTEVYSGTPLENMLRSQGRLRGDLFGYSYTISDERSQKAFEMYRKIFLPRNFDADGMNLQAMRLDYHFYLLQHFYPRHAGAALRDTVKDIIRKLNRNSAEILSEICDFVSGPKTHRASTVNDFVKRLVLYREEFDADMRIESQALLNNIKNLVPGSKTMRRIAGPVTASAAAAMLMITVAGCKGQHVEEPAPAGPPPTVSPQPQVRDLSKEEITAVESRIRGVYAKDFFELLAKHGVIDAAARDIKIEVHLRIGSDGRVVSSRIQTSKAASNEAFERELAAQIKTWVFPSIKKEGCCLVTLFEGIPWHMCEMMMKPMEPDAAKNEVNR